MAAQKGETAVLEGSKTNDKYYARGEEREEMAAQKEEIAALKATCAFQESKIERLESKLAGASKIERPKPYNPKRSNGSRPNAPVRRRSNG
eukprot:4012104-Pyramimonas_sp.AAC.1